MASLDSAWYPSPSLCFVPLCDRDRGLLDLGLRPAAMAPNDNEDTGDEANIYDCIAPGERNGECLNQKIGKLIILTKTNPTLAS